MEWFLYDMDLQHETVEWDILSLLNKRYLLTHLVATEVPLKRCSLEKSAL